MLPGRHRAEPTIPARLGANHTFRKSLEWQFSTHSKITVWCTKPRGYIQSPGPNIKCLHLSIPALLPLRQGLSLIQKLHIDSPGSPLNLPISGPSVGVRDPCSQVWLFKWVLGINWSRRAWLHNGLSQANFSFRFQNSGLHQGPSLVAVPEALWDIHQSLSFLPRLLALLSNMTIHLYFSARVGKVFLYLF